VGARTATARRQRSRVPAAEPPRRTREGVPQAAAAPTAERVRAGVDRTRRWDEEAAALIQREQLRGRKERVDAERELAEAMLPSRTLVRPLLVVVPNDYTGGQH